MATTKDENERQLLQPGALVSGNAIVSTPTKGAAVTNDLNNAAKFAKVPNGIGGNPAAAPKPVTPAENTPPAAPVAAPAATPAVAPAVSPPAPPTPAPALSPQAQSDRAKIGAAWDTVKDVNDDAGRAIADIATLIPRGLAGAYDSAVVRPMRAAGINANYLSSSLVPDGVDPASMTPFTDQKRMQQPAQAAGTAVARDGAAPTAYSAGAGRGTVNPPLGNPSQPAPIATAAAAAAEQSAGNAGPNWDRTGMSNAQVAAANPAGKVTMQHQANGTMSFSGGNVSGPVSYADGGGNPLAGGGIRGKGFSRVDSAPVGAGVGMDGSGNYAFSSNPVAAGAGATAPGGTGGAGQSAAGASSSASSAVNAAVAAAAQRGDWDAVGAHYAGRGQGFGGQSAGQIQQGQQQAGFSGVIGGGTLGFDPARRNAQFDRDQLNRTIMDPNTKRSMRSALVGMDQTAAQSHSSAQRLASEERRSAASNEAGLEQTAMREQGEDLRAANRNRLAAAELMQRGQEAGSRAELTNMEVAKAQRSANILQRYDSAKNEAERMAIIRQHPDVFGQKQAEPQGKDRYMTVGGGTSVVDGQTVREPTMVFDTVTKQYVGGAEKSLPPMDTNKQAMAIRDNSKLTYDQKVAELEKLGYNR